MRLYSAAILSLILSGSGFGQTYTIKTIAGGGLPENMPGLAARLGYVSGLTLDAAGDVIFVAGNTVLRLDTSGTLTRVAGSGVFGFGGDNGPATQAKLAAPIGISLDSAGNIYIADSNNHRIRKVTNGVITTVAGNGTMGFSGDQGAATDARLRLPDSVAVDAAGNLYINDRGNQRVRKVTNGVITTVAGGGSSLDDDVPAADARLQNPQGVVVDAAGNLYIPDFFGFHGRIRKIADGMITTIAGGGSDLGDTVSAYDARIGPEITAITVDSAGSLYFGDTSMVNPPDYGYRIRKLADGVITTLAGNNGEYGVDGPVTQVGVSFPGGLAVDAAGNLFLAEEDTSLVRKISDGVITTLAGGGRFSEDGPADGAQIEPSGIAVDSAGDVYFAEIYAQRVRKLSHGLITTVAGNGTSGENSDNGPAGDATLHFPGAVAFDGSGNLYIADVERIRKVSKDGVITTVAGGGSDSGDNVPATSAFLVLPFRFAVDSSGDVYISQPAANRIRKVSNGVITTVAGGGFDSGDDVPATTARLYAPMGLAVDSSGSLYFADANSNRVRKVSNGTITTVAGNGKQGFVGDNGPATSATLIIPFAVAVDSAGNLYISDTGNSRIRKVTNGVITTIAGNGTPGFSDDNDPATTLVFPGEISLEPAGNIYLTENDRIRVLTPPVNGR
jgi:sugar lactone lactonase YvrE